MTLQSKTPAQLGYHMPAEWEQHEATILAWPHNRADWPGKFAPIPWVYVDIIRHLSQVEKVRLLVKDQKAEDQARLFLEQGGANLDNVIFYTIPTNRIWMRDSGPIYVTCKQGKAMVDWRFNAWAKYRNHQFDNQIPETLNAALKLPRFKPVHKNREVVLEGGSIDVNGAGTLITTEECLLSEIQCRNPGFTREDYEQVFASYLGIDNVIWLGNGIVGDDTHGHVDDITRFVNKNTIVTITESNRKDDNYGLLYDNLKRLKRATDVKGKSFTIAELPMPKPVIFDGQRLPASYANFYIANGIVLVPTFNDPNDRVALSILAELMPKHEIIGIHSLDFVWGLGTLHCMSQQEPKG